ncbi:MAG TPA: PTS glucose transporter subunit IIA [Candidatus Mediterraneibacter merdavium]|nr:PTS glucose transporter subunit IIA [Candidatus Mediterraneibacter merdavium]
MLNKENKIIYELKAVANGKIIPLEELGDDIFAKRILGDGAAVMLSDGNLVSPADGVVTQISEEKHLYIISTPEGVNVIVHIGLDTVQLRGEGFHPHVVQGQQVKAGDRLVTVDLVNMLANGTDMRTPVIIAGEGVTDELEVCLGDAHAGDGVLVRYTLK